MSGSTCNEDYGRNLKQAPPEGDGREADKGSRALSLAHRRRLGGMVKQWSMDETQSWFKSRSMSQERDLTQGQKKAER